MDVIWYTVWLHLPSHSHTFRSAQTCRNVSLPRIHSDRFVQTGWKLHLWPFSQPPIYPAFLGWPLNPGCRESQPKGCDLMPFAVTFWTFDNPQSKSETVCPLGINDLSSPCLPKVCEHSGPSWPFISASFYYTTSSLLPCQHVVWGMGLGGCSDRGKMKKKEESRSRVPKAEIEAGRKGERHVNEGRT